VRREDCQNSIEMHDDINSLLEENGMVQAKLQHMRNASMYSEKYFIICTVRVRYVRKCSCVF